MSDQMTIAAYLAEGGVLSNPDNAPPRYRAELMRMMATFVDSELAGAAGFADVINLAPGIKERIAAAKIVLEKTHNAEQVLAIMGDFGANTTRYANHHPWTARLDRAADIGATRTESDMRLAVFNYPLAGWLDAVMMNLLMGLAVDVQLGELTRVSYQPLAEVFRAVHPIERRHAELAAEGLARLRAQGMAHDRATAALAYWWPRVSVSFGHESSGRVTALREWGLRHTDNAELRRAWESAATSELAKLELDPPA